MNGLIRKIIIGQNPKNAMAYYLGMKAGMGEVSTIVFDDDYMFDHNVSRYLIYLKTPGGGQVLWKCVENMPVMLEFDLNF